MSRHIPDMKQTATYHNFPLSETRD